MPQQIVMSDNDMRSIDRIIDENGKESLVMQNRQNFAGTGANGAVSKAL
jgi:hypothetical protein